MSERMNSERRKHRRLEMRVPVQCRPRDAGGTTFRASTCNVSTGGLYFELEVANGGPRPELRSLLDIEMTLPPGEGYFPYQGRVTSVGKVVRCDPLEADAAGRSDVLGRFGVGVHFSDPLKLNF